jgi:anti-sigma B factor antagonist
MSLDIAQKEREGITVLILTGRITAGDDVSSFREEAEKVLQTPEPKLILNLKGVDYIDSTGLGALVMCSTSIRKAGGAVRLVHLNRRNMELLVMTKIDTIFEAFDDETEAVNSFFPGRTAKRFDILSFVKGTAEE